MHHLQCLVLIVCLCASLCYSEHYIIVPNDFDGMCSNRTCIALDDISNNNGTFNTENATFSFLPGVHTLSKQIVMDGAISVSLTGNACNISQCDAKIKCQGTNGFKFQNIEFVNITALEFSGCGSDQTIHGGAIDSSNVKYLSITDSRFIDNQLTGLGVLGGAISIERNNLVSIIANFFEHNSVECKSSFDLCEEYWISGGAISLWKSNAVVESCMFKDNNAYASGGAISSLETNLKVINTSFYQNHVNTITGLGGAIFSRDGDVNTINVVHTNNSAENGGAVYMFNGTMSTTTTDYYNNTAALIGGAIYSRESNIFSTNSTYSSNTANTGGAIFLLGSNLSCDASHYQFNNALSHGGAIYALCVTTFITSQSYYEYNSAVNYGGGLYIDRSNISMLSFGISNCRPTIVNATSVNNTFFHNSASRGGGMYVSDGNVSCLRSYYNSNSVTDIGGAITLVRSDLTAPYCYFNQNRALRAGGAVFANLSYVAFSEGKFEDNEAAFGGALVIYNCTMYATKCSYLYNSAKDNGGAVHVQDSVLISSGCNFTNNVAGFGGALCMTNGFMQSDNEYYLKNIADVGGGAVCVLSGNMSLLHNQYISNFAASGGAIFVEGSSNVTIPPTLSTVNYSTEIESIEVWALQMSYVSISSCEYSDNHATLGGGAVYVQRSEVSSNNSYYMFNSVSQDGGVMYADASVVSTSNDHYTNNNADNLGGAIVARNSKLACMSTHYINNTASKGAVVALFDGSSSTHDSIFSYNRANESGGVFYVVRSTVKCLKNKYSHNTVEVGTTGGGVYKLTESLLHTSQSVYSDNSAKFGGAISCACHDVSNGLISTKNLFIDNVAEEGDGGAVAVSACTTSISGDRYQGNCAKSGRGAGGALAFEKGPLTIFNTQFTDNHSGGGGGAAFIADADTILSHTLFSNNTAFELGEGGAIYLSIENSTTTISNTSFNNNLAEQGGAISLLEGHLVLNDNCYFVNNGASKLGGAIVMQNGYLSANVCYFIQNEALFQGGAITVFKGTVITFSSLLDSNAALRGGAIYVTEGEVHNTNSLFFNNSAAYGGAVYFNDNGLLSNKNCSFITNKASFGGSVFALDVDFILSNKNCRFELNIALIAGGAICVFHGTVNNSATVFLNNTSNEFGGAVFVGDGAIVSTDTEYTENKADMAGGALCVLLTNVYSSNCLFASNSAGKFGGAIYTDSCSPFGNLSDSIFEAGEQICSKFEYFILKKDLLTPRESTFIVTSFLNNTSEFAGGAMSNIQDVASFEDSIMFKGNLAKHGGAIALAGGTLCINNRLAVLNNIATLSGGGVYSYKTNINFDSSSSQEITNNVASQGGGGLYASNSTIGITRGFVSFDNNNAYSGGAMYFEQSSKLILLKENHKVDNEIKIQLNFSDNYAEYGGAIFIADESVDKVSCRESTPVIQSYKQQCFIQTLLFNHLEPTENTLTNFINVFFSNNNASQNGDAIYGGLLDRCTINPSAELVAAFPEYERSNGFDYIRATAEFTGLVDYQNLTSSFSPDNFINAISTSTVKRLISSQPLRVCFCIDNIPNCSYQHQLVRTKKGQLFQLSVVAVDQVGNSINATIVSSFVSNYSEINVNQAKQDTSTECTNLEYNVYPKGEATSTQLELYALGPCNNIGISKQVLDVEFLPCTCPAGFHPVETKTLCRCECDPILRPYILSCLYENSTVVVDTNAWIDYVNSSESTQSGYVIYDTCPFDYCVKGPVTVNLNLPGGADKQCAFNRSGKLCGACKGNLSLVMGSSRCMECSDSYLALIIPFILAGIALVAFILFLNLSIATGTVHGLVLYANILAASRSIFVPIETPVILNTFISWVNLDIGIEACFFNGMDSYAKILLQLAFPVYILLISIAIIIVSEYSIPFSKLLGKKDPVGTLSTLIMLSYSKLIRTIVACLQYAYLDNPDGFREIVWLYDANVPYFTASHIPRFIIALLLILFGSVYTVLLLFGQWIPRCGNLKCFRWVNNPKYNAFIIKYQVPFTPNHRYWVGLLLLARIVHYVVAAFVTEGAILLSVCCIVVGILLLRIVVQGSYNKRSLDLLETCFLVNLLVFAAGTYYQREDSGNQTALASISLGISFLTFVAIFVHHFITYILKDTKLWTKIVQMWQRIMRIANNINRRPVYLPLDLEPAEDDNVDKQEVEMQPLYTNDSNGLIDLPDDYDPPIITPAVRYSRERRELDILDPINPADYQPIRLPAAPKPRPVPTSTVVDIIRPRLDQADGADSD